MAGPNGQLPTIVVVNETSYSPPMRSALVAALFLLAGVVGLGAQGGPLPQDPIALINASVVNVPALVRAVAARLNPASVSPSTPLAVPVAV